MASTVHNVGDWPARWARTAPDRLAVIDDEQRIDYASFEDRVARTAGWLRAEVEATLSEHPAIREVAVVGVANERWGETGRAHVVLEDGEQLEVAALRDWASDRLARFKLPSELAIEAKLPRTASGKVQKHRLSAG